MRMNETHEFHGITLRNDQCGWVIQLKLLGKYKQLRTHASTAEMAARRHDIALSKLEAFIEPGAQPNFPDAFENIDISRAAVACDAGGTAFFDELSSLFSALCKDADAVGLDPVELAKTRREAAQRKCETLDAKRKVARLKFVQGLIKLRCAVPSCRLSADKSKQVSDMLEQTQRIFELAS